MNKKKNQSKMLVISIMSLIALGVAGCNNNVSNSTSKGDVSAPSSTTSTSKPSASTSTTKPSTSTSSSVTKVTVTSIAITKNPTKVFYVEGEIFDKTGMEVTATYSDNTIKVISDYTIDKTSALKLTDTVITISYQGKNATINITVEKKIDITINEFKTYRMEAENLDFSQATLRDDFVTHGRTFIETPPAEYETSNGQSICGYKPGSIFEMSLNLLEESTLYITSRMSDTELNYKINEGVKFEMDSTLMTAEDVTFTFHGAPNYWEWKEVVIGKITLQAGVHTFKMTSLAQRPNIDYFQFETLKYGNQEK